VHYDWLISFCYVKQKGKRSYYKDAEVLTQVGAKIRQIRTFKEISQETLANDCEIYYIQVNRVDLGKVNFSILYLYHMAEALHVDPSELL
jgi:ribosome-binding protein aMBF1 (putative translation factor)